MSLAAYASETDNRVERVVNHHFASCSFVLDFRKWSEQVIKAVVKHLDLPQQGTGIQISAYNVSLNTIHMYESL